MNELKVSRDSLNREFSEAKKGEKSDRVGEEFFSQLFFYLIHLKILVLFYKLLSESLRYVLYDHTQLQF